MVLTALVLLCTVASLSAQGSEGDPSNVRASVNTNDNPDPSNLRANVDAGSDTAQETSDPSNVGANVDAGSDTAQETSDPSNVEASDGSDYASHVPLLPVASAQTGTPIRGALRRLWCNHNPSHRICHRG